MPVPVGEVVVYVAPPKIVGTSGSWEDVTPSGVAGTDALVHPRRPWEVYLGTAQGGLWKSTSFGEAGTWSKVNTGTNASVIDDNVVQGGAICANPSNQDGPPVIFLACGVTSLGTRGLLRSFDGGVNWDVLQPNNGQADPTFKNDVYSVAIDPTDPNHILCGFHGTIGLSESTNALAASPSFHDITVGGSGTQGESLFPFFIQPSPTEAGNGATISSTWLTQAQSGTGQGIWRTKDSGANWEKVLGLDHAHGNAGIVDMGIMSMLAPMELDDVDGLLYAAGYPATGVNQGIWKSTDYGKNWTNVYNTQPQGGVIATKTKLYGSNGYAASVSPHLITANRSSDTSWSNQTAPGSMDSGWKRASVSWDGSRFCIIGGFWGGSPKGGAFRYIE